MAVIKVMSKEDEVFFNRMDAGKRLAAALEGGDVSPVILGIPRGGMAVAEAAASTLDAELDFVLSHKVGAPWHSELAIGAVSECGKMFFDAEALLSVNIRYLEYERKRQVEQLKKQSRSFRMVLPKIPLQGRWAIVTDDGAAVGWTMQAALWAVRREKPLKLTVALPVASEEAIERFEELADEIVCLSVPESFQAVGQFYQDFASMDEEDVMKILRREVSRREEKSAKQFHVAI